MIYPVLAFAKDQMLSFRNEAALTMTARKTLKLGIYKHAAIVDSSGLQYLIRDAVEIGPAEKLWRLLTRPRQIRVRLEMESEPVPLPLEELQARVCHVLDHDAEFWSAIDSIDDLKSRVRECITHRAIIELFF